MAVTTNWIAVATSVGASRFMLWPLRMKSCVLLVERRERCADLRTLFFDLSGGDIGIGAGISAFGAGKND